MGVVVVAVSRGGICDCPLWITTRCGDPLAHARQCRIVLFTACLCPLMLDMRVILETFRRVALTA